MSLIAGFYMDVKGYDKQTSITGSRVQTIKKHKNASFKSWFFFLRSKGEEAKHMVWEETFLVLDN